MDTLTLNSFEFCTLFKYKCEGLLLFFRMVQFGALGARLRKLSNVF